MAGTIVSDVLQDGAGNSTATTNAISGSAKAWVNFNGTTASPSTIRASYNVGSVTKNGTGDYTLNFTNAFVDTNYAVIGTSVNVDCLINPTVYATATGSAAATMTTSAVRIVTKTSGVNYDVWGVFIACFR
jgi:hypothetical protein